MKESFKYDLRSLDSTKIYRKYILSGGCAALNDEQHYSLKQEISEKLSVDFTDVYVVGSSKTGFSIKPSRRYGDFNDESDIDIAVVSLALFETVWREAFLYKKSGADWPSSKLFFRYLSNGWVRPDKLPPSQYFKFSRKWWDIFNSLTKKNRYGPYKVRGGLYHSHFFLQEYQSICIEQCIQDEN